VGRLVLFAGPQQPTDGGRRAVGQEDEDRVAEEQDAAGNRQSGQLIGAEVADDGGVAEDVERLGDQRAQGRDGQPQDLAVVRIAPERGPRGQATS